MSSIGTLTLRGYHHPFIFRHQTTDKYVIAEVLVKRQYECVAKLAGVQTIVDAGANIGAASVYLLNRYPDARLIAIESDRGNFEVLRANLRGYGKRAVCLHNALWCDQSQMCIRRGSFRDGGEWSFQVQPAAESELADVKGISISELLMEFKIDQIDILKIDIEGAEKTVFEASGNWIQRVKTIAVELHDTYSRDAFAAATSQIDASLTHHGEVTVWQRSSDLIPAIP